MGKGKESGRNMTGCGCEDETVLSMGYQVAGAHHHQVAARRRSTAGMRACCVHGSHGWGLSRCAMLDAHKPECARI